MKLLFLYGPPATGKLTIAREVAKIADFRLFHNHATLNLAREIYPEFNGQLFGLTHRLRLAVFDYAAEQGTNIIFTNVYSGDDEDSAFVRDTVNTVASHEGEVAFVRLYAPTHTLLERVGSESRKKLRKVADTEKLQKLLSERDPFVSVPYDSYAVDTSKQEPNESAQLILGHFNF
jgi:shikimate kinase